MSEQTSGQPRRTMRQNLKELPAQAWLLTIGATINRFASFATVFLVLYLRSHGFSLPKAGAAVAAVGIGELVASVLGGHLADRIGRRNTIALSMFCSAASMLALSQVRPFLAILAVAFLAGTFAELYRPAGAALVADVVPEGQRVTAYAVLRFAINLGFAAGVATAGLLADHSFFLVFATDAASSIIFGVIALLSFPDNRSPAGTQGEGRGGYRRILSDRAFAFFLVASALVALVYFQQQTTLPIHVLRQGLSKTDFGLLLSLNGLIVVVFELPISVVTMRVPARQALSVGFLLIGLGFALTAVAHSMPMLFVTVGVWTVGEMISAPVGYAYVADLAPKELRGRYQGLYGLFWASGTVTGPILGGLLFTVSANGFWALCGVLGLAASALTFGIRQRLVTLGEDDVAAIERAPGGLKP
ncbi:MAG TPA: MFS transporter [Actinobacteria bacterium]|nr:MFS transporter [Actinomycetota bacterium]